MDYDFRMSSRLEQHYITNLQSAEKGVSQDQLIERTLNSGLNALDQLYLFVDPKSRYTRFEFSEKTISELTRGYTGEAETMKRQQLQKIEKKINKKLFAESQNRFNSAEAVFSFISNNPNVLDMMARNPLFYIEVMDKLLRLVRLEEANERTQSAVSSFFGKLSRLTTTLEWKSKSEWGEGIRREINQRLNGQLNDQELEALITKPGRLRDHEQMRLQTNFLTLARIFTTPEGDRDVEELKADGVKSERIQALEHFTSVMSKGLYKGYDTAYQQLETLGEARNLHSKMWVLYDGMFDFLKDRPELQELMLRSMTEDESVEHIDHLLKGIEVINNERLFKGLPVDLREQERLLIKSLPVKRYLETSPYLYPNAQSLACKMALSLFVASMAKGDLEGLDVAKDYLEKAEVIGNAFQSPTGTLNLLLSAQEILTPEELEVFKANYQARHTLDEDQLREKVAYAKDREEAMQKLVNEKLEASEGQPVNIFEEEVIAKMMELREAKRQRSHEAPATVIEEAPSSSPSQLEETLPLVEEEMAESSAEASTSESITPSLSPVSLSDDELAELSELFDEEELASIEESFQTELLAATSEQSSTIPSREELEARLERSKLTPLSREEIEARLERLKLTPPSLEELEARFERLKSTTPSLEELEARFERLKSTTPSLEELEARFKKLGPPLEQPPELNPPIATT